MTTTTAPIEPSTKISKKQRKLIDLTKVRNWKNSEETIILESQVFDWIKKTQQEDEDSEYQIIVGTDSHRHGPYFRFISVICIYKVGKGGNYYFLETYESSDKYLQGQRGRKAKGNQKIRMFDEVTRSIELAEKVFDETGLLPVVDIDASPSFKKEFTSEFSDQLKGYVTSAGFVATIKPDSHIASAVADRHTK